MSIPPHLQIYNPPASAKPSAKPSLRSFRSLPSEIRQQIWDLAVVSNRLIRIRLEPYKLDEDASRTQGGVGASKTYFSMIDRPLRPIPLFEVNREARQAALRFYRVSVPCVYDPRGANEQPSWERWKTDSATPFTQMAGVLRLNPENDHLQLALGHPVRDTFATFLHDLKTVYDPLGIGLLHLAFSTFDRSQLLTLEPSPESPEMHHSLKKTIEQLRSVWFLHPMHYSGRIVYQNHNRNGYRANQTFFNRSVPIATTTHGFTRLGRDPRPIWQDLKRLCVGNLYMDARGWDFYLERIDMTPRDCKYCIALSFSPNGTAGGEVSDHTSAAEMLRMEDSEWGRARAGLGAQEEAPRKPGIVDRLLSLVREATTDKEDAASVIRPAFGFWLFPFRDLRATQHDCQGRSKYGEDMVDMSNRWPELVLSDLQ